jgi:hypothetical protein
MKTFKKRVVISTLHQKNDALAIELLSLGYKKSYRGHGTMWKRYTSQDLFHDELEYLEQKYNILYAVL